MVKRRRVLLGGAATAGALGHVGKPVAVQAAIGVARNDLLVAVLVLAMLKNGRNQ